MSESRKYRSWTGYDERRVAEHGCCYLNAIIDCCTREIVGWEVSLRCRASEAITVIE